MWNSWKYQQHRSSTFRSSTYIRRYFILVFAACDKKKQGLSAVSTKKICSQLKRYNAIPCYYGERKKKKKIRGSKIRVLRLRWSQVFHFVPPFNYAKFHLTPCSLTPCWFNFALIASNFRDRVRYSTRGHKKSVKVMWQWFS